MKQLSFKIAVQSVGTVVSLLILISAFCPSATAKVACEYYSDDMLANFTSAPAALKSGKKLEINAKSVILMEPKTKTVLYADNENESVAPASITKIMSALLVMETIENEKLSLDSKVSASEHAASMGGSQIWLKPNETMTVDELLRATMIASANDATVALAEAVSGSEENFVQRMNERAKELGMKNTNFVNACGLDADTHMTTAHDVAIMASELIGHDLIKKYSTVWMDTLRDGKSELVNTNKLVRYYEGCTGLKTGTTSKAGSCVAATAQKNGMELVAVVMGGANSNERFSGAKKLLDYGFANWSFASLKADIEQVQPVKVKNGVNKTVIPQAGQTVNVLLEKGKTDKVTQKINFENELNAPVAVGQQIGTVTFWLNEKQIGEVPITTATASDKITFFYCLVQILSSALRP